MHALHRVTEIDTPPLKLPSKPCSLTSNFKCSLSLRQVEQSIGRQFAVLDLNQRGRTYTLQSPCMKLGYFNSCRDWSHDWHSFCSSIKMTTEYCFVLANFSHHQRLSRSSLNACGRLTTKTAPQDPPPQCTIYNHSGTAWSEGFIITNLQY